MQSVEVMWNNHIHIHIHVYVYGILCICITLQLYSSTVLPGHHRPPPRRFRPFHSSLSERPLLLPHPRIPSITMISSLKLKWDIYGAYLYIFFFCLSICICAGHVYAYAKISLHLCFNNKKLYIILYLANIVPLPKWDVQLSHFPLRQATAVGLFLLRSQPSSLRVPCVLWLLLSLFSMEISTQGRPGKWCNSAFARAEIPTCDEVSYPTGPST